MIAPEVAVDKLSAFACADELADFFEFHGILGLRRESAACPIANWIRKITGMEVTVYAEALIVAEPVIIDGQVFSSPTKNTRFDTTDAMYDFIATFDDGGYSYLSAVDDA